MPKKQHTVLFSFKEFLTEIKIRLPHGTDLSPPQEAVLYSVWANLTYEELTTTYDYDDEYLRCVASQLWLILSPIFKQKVSKTNLLTLLEKDALKEDSSPSEQKLYGVPVRTDHFIGRIKELKFLSESVKAQRCIIVSGAKGVGKTSLVSKIFNDLANQDAFEQQVWTFTELQDLEKDAEQIFSLIRKNRTVSATEGLVNLFRFSKSLIIIDGVDSWLKDDSETAKQFINKVVESNHQSCLLLTVSEPLEFGTILEKQGRLILNYQLEGLSQEDSKALFKKNGIRGPVDKIIESYRGIPSLLLYACETINYMGGDVNSFVENKTLFSTDASKQRFNQLFLKEDFANLDRVKSVLYFIYKNAKESQILLSDFFNKAGAELGQTKPTLLSVIKELEKKSLISVNRSLEHPLILLHAETRGYIAEDPMSIFKSYEQDRGT